MQSPVLVGGRQIAAYMRVSLKTIYRWIECEAFPAGKAHKGRWITTPSLIDAWILSRGHALLPKKDLVAARDAQRLKWKTAREKRNRRIADAIRDEHEKLSGRSVAIPALEDSQGENLSLSLAPPKAPQGD